MSLMVLSVSICTLHRSLCVVYVCRYVLLVSGLGLGSSWSDQLSVDMLVDYITGQLGGAAVSHVISSS